MANSQSDLIKDISNMQSRREDFRNKNLNKLIISRLKEGDMLDVGCGSGSLISCATQKGIQATGLEIEKQLIELSRKYHGNLNIIHKPAEEINKISQKFDNITMIDVLEHIDEDGMMVKKVYNQLKNNGRFIINVPAIKLLHTERTRLVGDKRRYSKKELITILKRNNFAIKEIRYWNFLGLWSSLFVERILKIRLPSNIYGLRSDNPKGIKKYMNLLLNIWFDKIENNINFGIGASLFCVAENQ